MKKKIGSRILDVFQKPEFSTLTILTVMIVIAASLQSNFFTQQTIVSNINTFAPLIMLSLGQAVSILSGGYDFSVGNAMALILCVMTKTMDKNVPISGLYAILLGAAVALLIGIVNGIAVGYLRLSPFIATFTTSYMWMGIALLIMPKPGGAITKWFRVFYNFASAKTMPAWLVNIGKVIPPALMLILLLCAAWFVLSKTKTGRYIHAVGSNFDNAYFRGIKAGLIQTKAYIFSAFCAFACALFYAGQNGAGNAQLGMYMTLQAAAAAIVGGIAVGGGKGNVFMSIAGAVIMSLVGRIIYFAGISSNWQMLVSGVIIIAAIGSSALYSTLRKRAMLREVKASEANK